MRASASSFCCSNDTPSKFIIGVCVCPAGPLLADFHTVGADFIIEPISLCTSSNGHKPKRLISEGEMHTIRCMSLCTQFEARLSNHLGFVPALHSF